MTMYQARKDSKSYLEDLESKQGQEEAVASPEFTQEVTACLGAPDYIATAVSLLMECL